MTTSLWKPSPKASGSGPTSARRRASGTFEAVRSSREKRAFDRCDRKCSLIVWRKTHECAAWAAPPATTRRNLLSASSDESREYSNTLEAALDGPKRSKSLCMRYSCSTALRSTDLACRRTRKSLGAPPPLAWNPITQSLVEVYFQFRVSARCSLGCVTVMFRHLCGERTSRYVHHIALNQAHTDHTIRAVDPIIHVYRFITRHSRGMARTSTCCLCFQSF